MSNDSNNDVTQESSDNSPAKTFDESYVKDLRSEAANYRTKLREKEQEFDEFKSQYESKQKESLTKELLFAAKEAGAVDPSVVSKLVDMDSLESNDGDYSEAIKGAVGSLLADKPFLKGGSVGKASNPVGGNGQPKVFTREVVENMTQEEINANWQDIQSQMSKGLLK